MTRQQTHDAASWMERRSYWVRVERFGIERIRELARENGKRAAGRKGVGKGRRETVMSRKSDTGGVFKRKDRDGFWISWTDAQGWRRYRKTDAQTLAEARAARGAGLHRVEKAKTLGFSPPGADTFSEVAPRFLSHQRASLTQRAYLREELIIEKHLKPFFPVPLASIRRLDVQRYVTKRSSQASAHTVPKELNILKQILRLAVKWEIVPANHAQGVRSPKVPAGRVHYLQPTELRARLEASPEWLQSVVGLAVSTGMRRSEILGLRWLNVDLQAGRLLLPQTKNGDGRIVYLNQIAASVLNSIPNGNLAKLLFPGLSPEQVSMAFARACRRTAIEDFRFHDLRHTAASWLRMTGADIHTVAQLLGHKDLRMAARYQHLSPAFLSEAVNRLDGVFADLRYPGVTANAALIEAAPATA